ncbi:peptidase MA family metallohydrolase [Stigmatella aurantiaca]|uniref:Tetratricopeptide repeat domain protein n=1 Tax=Stigmatella aurantiaca (strain DW4/3-1) TaxID=378806 RepID=Q09E03_STIAD|nr:tetratricopeptide repeat protein [Stigmatella aurantiaca]ADO75156.1 Tetratricopeptide repeat domain protein [Stigmatella aurantiaca DW4/3-1]EAU69940.1 tetratricopeptide repeat domain protein [Stigmatella aurantiaca DW4/3-1]
MSPNQDASARGARPRSGWNAGLGALLALLTLLLAAPPAHADDELKNEVKSRLTKIEEALDGWDVVGARRELTELEELVPADIEPLKYFQGRIAFEEGLYTEAVELLQASRVEDKPGSYLRLAKDTQRIFKNHQRTESDHFILFYPKGKEEILVPYALETLEATYRAMVEDLGWTPPGKVRVELVNNARELSKVSTLTYEQIQTTGTIAICKFSKLMLTSPKAVARGYDWQDTLAHEYIHLVVSQMSHNTVPIWLHEGLAKFMESRWRGKAGMAMTPSTLALLGRRVKADTLVPFEKMHPSIAMLPTAEDAATAFAEVYYAIDYVHQTKGTAGLRTIIQELRKGQQDRKAVEIAMGVPFALFEKSWLAHIKKQPFPKELLPREEVVLKEHAKDKDKEDPKKGKEISFGDFVEVTEIPARKFAHLGELLRERNRILAASEEYAKAHDIVGDKYESVSNKYALALLHLKRLEEAEQVLRGSLRVHPGSPQTNVHLGRILLFRKDYPKAKAAYQEALSTNPFDPEVHVALTRIHQALGETVLEARTRAASALLLNKHPDQVDTLVRAFLREHGQLSEMDVSGEPEEAPASKPSPDGGP